MSGADQLTATPVPDGDTLGAPGVPGGSTWFTTLTDTSTESEAVPSLTVTVTLRYALTLSSRSMCASTVIWPPAIANSDACAPESDQVKVSPSASVAVNGSPTFVPISEFSVTWRSFGVLLVITGAWFALMEPAPLPTAVMVGAEGRSCA